jgi:hypothetical protein
MTEVEHAAPRRYAGKIAAAVIGIPAAGYLVWLAMLGALYVPVVGGLLTILLPIGVIVGGVWLTARRWRWFAVAFAVSGVLTVVFMIWLLWTFSAGMADFD